MHARRPTRHRNFFISEKINRNNAERAATGKLAASFPPALLLQDSPWKIGRTPRRDESPIVAEETATDEN